MHENPHGCAWTCPQVGVDALCTDGNRLYANMQRCPQVSTSVCSCSWTVHGYPRTIHRCPRISTGVQGHVHGCAWVCSRVCTGMPTGGHGCLELSMDRPRMSTNCPPISTDIYRCPLMVHLCPQIVHGGRRLSPGMSPVFNGPSSDVHHQLSTNIRGC